MISDWNTVILSKIKSILSKLDKSNVAVENISTNISSMENSVSEMLNRIGLTGDTDGSQTAETLFAKENAILEMLNGYKGKSKNNMILKQTSSESTIAPSTGYINIAFDFEKPVRIIGLYLSFAKASGVTSVNIPVYIINGENSYMFTLYGSTLGLFKPVFGISNSRLEFRYDTGSNTALISDIWATRLVAQVSGAKENSNISSYVIYQEEG